MRELKEFYKNTKVPFFNYLLKLTGDYDLASDLMQDTYIKIYENYKVYNKSLLYKIAYNLYIDFYRKSKKNSELNVEVTLSITDVEESLIAKEDYKNLLKAMQKLPLEERQILSLKVSDNLSYKEISEITGLTVANIKVKIHRARQKLRQILKGGLK
ncbi:RNA polymerase sigma factor [Deferribacter abyssi]|uniref:RNA polymerase sigma factor n=1 Tax=Deferribacter abyssi TaxID=213806 RepID=UPI003C23CC63